MHWKSQRCTAQPSNNPVLEATLDPGSLFADKVSLFNLATFFNFAMEEKQSFNQSFQTLLSESNQELATLLREVRISSDAAQEGGSQTQPGSDLLMRAVRCAVKQHMLQAEFSGLALRDELTGLYNRRGFFSLIERQLKLTGRSGSEMLLFFIDVDGMKGINDSFGHSEGDSALMRTAEVLTETFRDSDVFARLGGDEFAALAIEASGRSEGNIMARLDENLATVNARELRYLLSLSIGVVRFTHATTNSIAELMLQADRAMYLTKRNQRSSVGQSRVTDRPVGPTESPHFVSMISDGRNASPRTHRGLQVYEPEAIPITAITAAAAKEERETQPNSRRYPKLPG
jgi:diguanylate cyclase (GGDEF)-like protein